MQRFATCSTPLHVVGSDVSRRSFEMSVINTHLFALLVLVSGCKKDPTGDKQGSAKDPAQPAAPSGGKKVALLLPESKTARYESQDRVHFERRLKELCPECTLIYSNADQDSAKQQNQAEAALTNGANVLVIDPVDSKSAAAMVARAKQS